jgi:glutathione S-transferase
MLQLFAHPFSSYCQKVLIALYENATPFELRMLDPEHGGNFGELLEHWPIGKFPLLLDGGVPVFESSLIIEHLAQHHPGPVALIPEDRALALEVRRLDRVFDTYVMTPMQKIVGDAMRADDAKDATGVAEAHGLFDKAYGWLDTRVAGRQWGAGGAFTLADCAAAPALFFADWVHPIADTHGNLKAYRARLLARPSVARAVDEARPYRAFFPPGAPDRD